MPHPAFERQTLLRALKPLTFVLAIMALIWFWNQYRKVDIDLTLQTRSSLKQPESLVISIYDDDDKSVGQIESRFVPGQNIAYARLSLRPGNYRLSGIVQHNDQENISVEQTLTIPNDNARMLIFLNPSEGKRP